MAAITVVEIIFATWFSRRLIGRTAHGYTRVDTLARTLR